MRRYPPPITYARLINRSRAAGVEAVERILAVDDGQAFTEDTVPRLACSYHLSLSGRYSDRTRERLVAEFVAGAGEALFRFIQRTRPALGARLEHFRRIVAGEPPIP